MSACRCDQRPGSASGVRVRGSLVDAPFDGFFDTVVMDAVQGGTPWRMTCSSCGARWLVTVETSPASFDWDEGEFTRVMEGATGKK